MTNSFPVTKDLTHKVLIYCNFVIVLACVIQLIPPLLLSPLSIILASCRPCAMPSGVIAGQADRMFHPSPANSPILYGITHVAHNNIVADIKPMIPHDYITSPTYPLWSSHSSESQKSNLFRPTCITRRLQQRSSRSLLCKEDKGALRALIFSFPFHLSFHLHIGTRLL
jgi:hypothetical protein